MQNGQVLPSPWCLGWCVLRSVPKEITHGQSGQCWGERQGLKLGTLPRCAAGHRGVISNKAVMGRVVLLGYEAEQGCISLLDPHRVWGQQWEAGCSQVRWLCLSFSCLYQQHVLPPCVSYSPAREAPWLCSKTPFLPFSCAMSYQYNKISVSGTTVISTETLSCGILSQLAASSTPYSFLAKHSASAT